jgi:hypothetical protein
MNRPTVLTEAEVRLIHEDRRSYRDIGIAFGVSAMTVSNIKGNRTWKHLGLKKTTRGRNYKPFPESNKDE